VLAPPPFPPDVAAAETMAAKFAATLEALTTGGEVNCLRSCGEVWW